MILKIMVAIRNEHEIIEENVESKSVNGLKTEIRREIKDY
jgi:hypothetical protein